MNRWFQQLDGWQHHLLRQKRPGNYQIKEVRDQSFCRLVPSECYEGEAPPGLSLIAGDLLPVFTVP